MNRWCASLLLIFVAATMVAAQVPSKESAQPNGTVDKLKNEIKHLQGKWKLILLVHDGKPVKSGDNVLNFKGEQITEKSSEDVIQYKLNPGKEPKEIDLLHLKGRHKGETFPGIYMLEGDLLLISHGHYAKRERPVAFESLPDTGARVLLFRRVKSQ